MEITPQLFDHIAHLSRLHFEAGEKDAIRADMQKMVVFFEQLNQLNVEGVAPLVFPAGAEQEMRSDDSPAEPIPTGQNGNPVYYTVPKVIENPGA
ncbi:MAG: Asp-tRNA(Asn)/Glu-tRNA(Gln) amidotransferase subunit GatC [Dinghuibacter sp.]|nr:Asp-tRNA(Asn)/Glu-tRNA(Gln) amidotransferase subunit GatC [Dinghuibacter sp.]